MSDETITTLPRDGAPIARFLSSETITTARPLSLRPRLMSAIRDTARAMLRDAAAGLVPSGSRYRRARDPYRVLCVDCKQAVRAGIVGWTGPRPAPHLPCNGHIKAGMEIVLAEVAR